MAERRFNPLDPLGLFQDKGGSLTDQFAKLAKGNNPTSGNKLEITRKQGLIIQVGPTRTKMVLLPDWDLSYVEFPPGEKSLYRDAFGG